jgi:hypothetical protein
LWVRRVLSTERLDTGTYWGNFSNFHPDVMAKNTTVRENICFGRPFEEKKYWDAVRRACLEPDLEIFPNGDLTEVGERVKFQICRLLGLDDLMFSIAGHFAFWWTEAEGQYLPCHLLRYGHSNIRCMSPLIKFLFG